MKNESCLECSTTGGCPFAFNDISEQIQNYGCLPTPKDIINMRQHHGKTWACHSNPDKPCLGAINWLKKNNMPFNVLDGDLITEKDNWSKFT